MVKCRVEPVLRALNLVKSGCFTDRETVVTSSNRVFSFYRLE